MEIKQVIVILIFSQVILCSVCNLQDGESIVRILLVGTSGCGKSSAINFLLNQSITAVGDTSSTTSAIHEYSIHFNGLGNVTFIDTPGIGDTRGLEVDAQTIASLQQFLETNNKEYCGLPDIILLCHRFDDNRFSGEGSIFGKMLKAMVLLNEVLLSQEETNVALLLTHAGAVNSKVTVTNKIKAFTNVGEEFLSSISPSTSTQMDILLGENKGEAQELETENSNEFNITSYIIPHSNQSYPENLCQFFKKSVVKNSAKVKLIQLLCQRQFSSIAEINTFYLLSTNDTKVKEMTEYLTKINLKISSTPISVKLGSAYEALNGNNNISAIMKPDDLAYLQKALNLQGIINLEDFPSTDVEISSLVRKLKINEDSFKLLKTAFQVTLPKLPAHVDQVGFHYDFKKTRLLPESLFDMKQFQFSSVGYEIPKPISCALVPPPKGIWLSQEKVNQKTYLNIHYRFMHCQLQDNVQILREQITRLNALNDFNATDYENIFQWKKFLDQFGVHLVTETYIGGVMTIFSESDQLDSTHFGNLTSFSAQQNLLTQFKHKFNSLTDWKVKTIGGNTKYYTSYLQKLLAENGKLFNYWVKSIPDNAVVTFVNTKPIETYLQSHNHASEAAKFSKAQELFAKLLPNGFEQSLIDKNNELAAKQQEIIQQHGKSLKQNEMCQKELNITHSQNFEIAKNMMTSKNELREIKIKLESEKLNSTRLNSELNDAKLSLTKARSEITKEQDLSKSLSEMLTKCNSNGQKHIFLKTAVFYMNENFQGPSEAIVFPDYECRSLRPDMWDLSSSINTHGNCIIVYYYSTCSGKFQRIGPGSSNHHKLSNIGFDNDIRSARVC